MLPLPPPLSPSLSSSLSLSSLYPLSLLLSLDLPSSIPLSLPLLQKLNRKYQSNTLRYHTLQSMVLEEFNAGSQNARNSATDALLWLKRYKKAENGSRIIYICGVLWLYV